jgi:hypothetical protein
MESYTNLKEPEQNRGVDSQAVKNTCNASVESKGFVSTKRLMDKRHIGVDTLGFRSLRTALSLMFQTMRD